MTHIQMNCPNCGGVLPFHNAPCTGPLPYYAPMPAQPPLHGAQPIRPLTEDDVRRIVREELAKQQPPAALLTIGRRP